MGRLDEVQKEERALLEKEETITDGMKQLSIIKEEYEQQFHEASRFFHQLEFQFQKSNDRIFFENMTDEIHQKSRQILERLEIDTDELHNEKRTIEHTIDELAYEKKRVAMEEEKNEH